MSVIAVYGATGYTGRLVAEELARRGLEARLCGRNGGKLKALCRSLSDVGEFSVGAAAVDDPAALRRALDGASVVLSCAGPFTFYGAPVIEAALDVGAHYCDTTGEQPYMKRVFEHLGPAAATAGRAVVPAVGFDIVPGDLAAALAARGLDDVDEVVVAYAISDFAMTRGTMHSALEMLRGGDLEYVDGSWQPVPGGVLRESFAFGEPIGEQVVARFPGGEIVTVPQHVPARSVRGRMTAGSYAPHSALASAVPYAVPALGLLLGSPLRGPLDAVIDRLPEGPSDEQRERCAWTIVAEARGAGGSVGRCTVRGRDPYGITAVIAVEMARQLTDFAQSGALAPAQVVDPQAFLDGLAPHGVEYAVEPAATPARV